MDTADKPKVRYKTFTFKTRVSWAGKRGGVLRSDGKVDIRMASPPEFKGEAGVWSPEDLFVASVESCLLMTFLDLAGKRQLPLASYESHANGVLEFIDGDYRFTRIVVFPTIVVAKTTKEDEVYAVLRDAHAHCLVANSISSIIELNPTIVLQ